MYVHMYVVFKQIVRFSCFFVLIVGLLCWHVWRLTLAFFFFHSFWGVYILKDGKVFKEFKSRQTDKHFMRKSFCGLTNEEILKDFLYTAKIGSKLSCKKKFLAFSVKFFQTINFSFLANNNNNKMFIIVTTKCLWKFHANDKFFR